MIYKPGWHTQNLSQGLLRKFSQLWLFGLCVQGMCLHNAHLGFSLHIAGPKESQRHAASTRQEVPKCSVQELLFFNSDTDVYEDYVTVEIKYCDCLLNKKTIIPES